ncbi:tudor domain-containing protein 7 isoform X2 [Harmonia axyridis]|uniref:tudor domain-containing protein 7 isoform X2 n=1 Tax=Harmonia axyridis TaxID=115357 RepID=UPI001E276B4B|nr:tudor domain-containing protein 7 isoform X2 [Harmonia axyridis]
MLIKSLLSTLKFCFNQRCIDFGKHSQLQTQTNCFFNFKIGRKIRRIRTNMDEDKEKNEVISNIRACLISVKGRVSLRQLETDYRVICGQRIPYSRLGFRTIQDFISSIPSLMLTKSSTGEYFVDAQASEKSIHITDMVSKQKNAKKKPISRPTLKPYRMHSNITRPMYSNLTRPMHSNISPPKNWNSLTAKYKPKKYNDSERTAALSHNQFINRSPIKTKINTSKPKPSITEQTEYKKPIDPIDPPKKIPPSKISEPVSGILLTTPFRINYRTPSLSAKLPNSHDYNTVGKMRSSNVEDHKSPVDLATFSASLMENSRSMVESSKTTVESSTSLVKTSRKRLCKMMSETSLDRDSGNSSPTNDVRVPVDDLLTGNAIDDLKTIVDLYKLGKIDVNHTVMQSKKKYAKALYNCTITVDGQTYLSYPEEFHDANSAQVYCAQKALDELLPKCARKRKLLLATSKDIKERIPPMLQMHAQGIWSSRIEEDYADLYLEQLPTNWLEIIDSCECVAVERIQDDRYVLRFCKPGMKGEKFGSILPPDVSIPSTTVDFGEDNRLLAVITCIMSLNEIWCQQLDNSQFDTHNEVITKMENYYSEEGEKLRAKDVQIGSFYVALYECNWYRVRALEVKEDCVNCFLIDYGDEYLIQKDMICDIKREFAISPAQAFVCRLAGLEDLYDANVQLEKLVSYIGKEVILTEQSASDVTEADQTVAVDMYDLNDGVCINKQLLKFLTIEIATPIIRQNTIETVYISHVSDNGIVYIQIHSKGFTSLQCLMQHIEVAINHVSSSDYIERINRFNWELNKDKIYLSKDQGHWFRSKILDMSPDGEHAQVYFIDRGNFNVVKVAEEVFYRLEDISEVLYQFPPQAVMVKMALEAFPKNFAHLAAALLKEGSSVLLKVIGTDENGIPIGEFYRRSNEEGLLCINKSIAMEMEISSRNESNPLKGTKSKLDKLTQNVQKEKVPSSGSLMSPKLPEMGAYFGVNIPFTVNPWNYFVQPYNSKDQLDSMMVALQERYKNTTCSSTQAKNIVPGQIFAAKHTDGIWYRTSVLKVIHSGSISVFYCDFGYYSNLSVSQLIPLDAEFTKLPFQALKAKLSGIKPKKNKWSMEDCEVFSELVKGKALISVLMDIEKDELYESDPVLKLTLIDTTTDEDIFIDQELIRRNIAIKAD